MLDQNELLFVVDEENKPLDPLPRAIVHEKNLWHRTVHVWVINKKKEVLCNQRSLLKDILPGKWNPYFGGHLAPHTAYAEGAITELHEESGIQIEKERLQFYKIYKNENAKHHQFQAIFIYVWDGNLELLSFEENEIEKIEWVRLKKLKELLSGEAEGWSKIKYSKELIEHVEKLSL